jgi:DNA topoisomerase-2
LDTGDAAERFDMAFNKAKAEERKNWLTTKYDVKKTLDLKKTQISFGEFIDNELIFYAHDDNIRSIPSAIDGLKPSQRKILYSCFKRKLVSEIKVAQLAGYVSEQTAYHHGEQSLNSSIVKLAQDFVGSNNVPFLEANGQFGTRVISFF